MLPLRIVESGAASTEYAVANPDSIEVAINFRRNMEVGLQGVDKINNVAVACHRSVEGACYGTETSARFSVAGYLGGTPLELKPHNIATCTLR